MSAGPTITPRTAIQSSLLICTTSPIFILYDCYLIHGVTCNETNCALSHDQPCGIGCSQCCHEYSWCRALSTCQWSGYSTTIDFFCCHRLCGFHHLASHEQMDGQDLHRRTRH